MRGTIAPLNLIFLDKKCGSVLLRGDPDPDLDSRIIKVIICYHCKIAPNMPSKYAMTSYCRCVMMKKCVMWSQVSRMGLLSLIVVHVFFSPVVAYESSESMERLPG